MQWSEDSGELFAALAKAQGQFETARKDSEAKINSSKGQGSSYGYKFADLAAVVAACRRPLSDNGLAVTQHPETISNDTVRLTTVLTHSSGQWMRSEIDAGFHGFDIKQLGSAITYLRRYSWMAMLGIVADDDDDGSTAPAMQGRSQYQQTRRDEPRDDRAPTRDDINREFSPRQKAQEPARPGPLDAKGRERTKLAADKIGARGLDVRDMTTVINREVEIANQVAASYLESLGFEPQEATNSFELTNHLVKKSIEAGAPNPRPIDAATGKPKKVGIGVLTNHLTKLYAHAEWREWIREEVGNYVEGKVQKIQGDADRIAHTDPPGPGEGESQEPAEKAPAMAGVNGQAGGGDRDDPPWDEKRE